MVEHATIPNVANLVDVALQDAMVDAPGGSTYDDDLFVKALAGNGLAITRPTGPALKCSRIQATTKPCGSI